MNFGMVVLTCLPLSVSVPAAVAVNRLVSSKRCAAVRWLAFLVSDRQGIGAVPRLRILIGPHRLRARAFPATSRVMGWSAIRGSRSACFAGLLTVSACGGRTPLLPPTCEPRIRPAALDFGEVAAGETVSLRVTVTNLGGASCSLSGVRLDEGTDVWFSLPSLPSPDTTLTPGSLVTYEVAFRPERATTPLTRHGGLVFNLAPAYPGPVRVPLTGKIRTNCHLAIAPSAVDFGQVPLDESPVQMITIANVETDPCEASGFAMAPDSDPQFLIPLAPAGVLAIQAGEAVRLGVSFHATDTQKPRQRTGRLVFATSDERQANVAIPLSAGIDVGCELIWTPGRVDFGDVVLNTTADAALTLLNDGTATCQVSSIALAADNDPGFFIDSAQPTALTLVPASQATIALHFRASDSSPPHEKTGSLTFDTGNRRAPKATIPLVASVDTVCVERSRWIYTLDEGGTLSQFDPSALTFTDVGRIDCPSRGGTPNSMAVDQSAVAWVNYTSGELFKVDTTNARCEPTGFVVDQHDMHVFGMGSVFDPKTGVDTLYIAGALELLPRAPSRLATISFPDLVVHPIGSITAGFPELSGTGDATLWGFIPAIASTSEQTELVRIDPRSGATLETYTYSGLEQMGAWAMKYWGGSFWVFLGTAVYEIDRENPDKIRTALRDTGRSIVGAGVSSCAPLD